jgi:hypothetical protein
MRRVVILVALATASLFVTPATSEACTCIPSGPPCQAVWDAPLVFTGRVTEIIPLSPESPGMPPHLGPKRIRFAITESFRGSDDKSVELHSRGGGSGMCEYPFRAGHDYLVYAHNRGDAAGWTTSICTRTRELRDAGDDLAYLRLPSEQKGTSRILGRVIHHVFDPSTMRTVEKLVAGVQVRVTDGKAVFNGVTDSSGMYSIKVTPLRAYDVTFGTVEGLNVESAQWRPAWIGDYRACAEVNGTVRPRGRDTP